MIQQIKEINNIEDNKSALGKELNTSFINIHNVDEDEDEDE